jgi:hypothetical protein
VREPALILTLRLESSALVHFDGLRRRHFPAGSTPPPAHVGFFQRLPVEREAEIAEVLTTETSSRGPMTLEVAGVRLMERGVGYDLLAPALMVLHTQLAARWSSWLHPDDLQPYHPHIAVQSGVSADAARRLHIELSRGFTPYSIRGTGLDLWRHLAGPWRLVESFAFASDEAPQAEPTA